MKSRVLSLTVTALAGAALAVLAPLAIPLGIAPVLLSLATPALILTAGLLGSLRGAVATLVYLAVGALGLPVFSGFTGGFGVIVGPSGGFLLGYLPFVLTAGLTHRLPQRRFCLTAAPILLLAHLPLYLLGALGFARVAGVGFLSALSASVLPFVLFDLIKLIIALGLLESLRRVMPKI